MSLLSSLKTNFAAWAVVVAVALTSCPRLFAAEKVAVGQKCAAHAKEWERLQADKKFSLAAAKNNKEELEATAAYYAKKEALLLRKMFLCDNCRDKQGKLEDLSSTGGGNKPQDPTNPNDPGNPKDPHIVRGEQLAKMSPNVIFPRHVSIVAQPGERVIERISNDLNFDPKAYKLIWESVDRGFKDATTEWVFLVNDKGVVTRSWDRKRYEAEAKTRR
jgi:hypothetical protein